MAVAQPRTLRIAEPKDMAEAWGSELYPLSFNDGFDFFYAGERLEKPYWWAYHEAERLGHFAPRDYAHGFCDGYREAERQDKSPALRDAVEARP